jgi:hypothetical protein
MEEANKKQTGKRNICGIMPLKNNQVCTNAAPGALSLPPMFYCGQLVIEL